MGLSSISEAVKDIKEGRFVIIVDDEPSVCKVISDVISKFYTWGEVISFIDVDEAVSYCLSRDEGIAIFVIDVFLGGKSGFCQMFKCFFDR